MCCGGWAGHAAFGGGRRARVGLQRGCVWAGLKAGDGQRWPGTTVAGMSAQGLSRTARDGVRVRQCGPHAPHRAGVSTTVCKTPRRLAGQGCPAAHTTQTPHWPETPTSESGTGVRGCTHLPSSGSHTRCRPQTWSWARQSCGSAPVGGVVRPQPREPRAGAAPATPTFQPPDGSPLTRPHVSWV